MVTSSQHRGRLLNVLVHCVCLNLLTCIDLVTSNDDYISFTLDFGNVTKDSLATERGQLVPHYHYGMVVRMKGFEQYCGKGMSIGCSTTFEQEYVKKNLDSLQQGLKAIRHPGCYEPGMFIVSGIFRSGSTLLFNQARLWLLLATAGENLYAGFNCGMPIEHYETYPITKTKPTMARTILCKTHNMSPKLLAGGKVKSILMSRRKPEGSICSRKLRGLFCNNEKWVAGVHDPLEKKRRMDDCLENHLREETEYQCDKLMELQASAYFKAMEDSYCVKYDRLLESYYEVSAR